MKKELRSMLLSGVLITGTVGSALAFAQNATQTPAQTPAQTQAQATPAQTQAPAFTGSVQVAQGAARYLDMATVSLQDAVTAAQGATSASAATSVELEVVNGYLVWNVTVNNQEVLVDAGNGQVLQTLQAEAQEDESGEEMQGRKGHENETGQNETGQNEGGQNEGGQEDSN